MRSTLDCIPCLTSLVLRIARQATDDTELHEQVLREATAALRLPEMYLELERKL